MSEVFVDREMAPREGVRSAETVASVASYHMTPAQVARLAKEARVGAVALRAPRPARRRLLGARCRGRAGYDRPVIVGEDLMTIALPERLVTRADLAFAY